MPRGQSANNALSVPRSEDTDLKRIEAELIAEGMVDFQPGGVHPVDRIRRYSSGLLTSGKERAGYLDAKSIFLFELKDDKGMVVIENIFREGRQFSKLIYKDDDFERASSFTHQEIERIKSEGFNTQVDQSEVFAQGL